MTKEVEVGDEFTGKVVKTTTFGAFIELAKGTDGLLHISNIKPGERVNTVEDVVNRGDELVVKVVEVDRERGRIGLRLAEDPEISGKSADELASMGTGDKGGLATAAATAAAAGATATTAAGVTGTGTAAARATATATAPRSTAPARLTTLDSGVRVVTEAMPSVRSIALGFMVRTGSRDEASEQAGISHFLEHLLFKGTDRFSSREIDEAFDAMGAEVNAGTGKETTSVYSRSTATSSAPSMCCRTWFCGRPTSTSTRSARW